MKTSAKKRGTTVCFSTNPRQYMRQVSGHTLQQVETFTYLAVVLTCDGRPGDWYMYW